MSMLLPALIAALSSSLPSLHVRHDVTQRSMAPEVIAAWTKAGAVYGRVRLDENDSPYFDDTPTQPGDLPAFQVPGYVGTNPPFFSMSDLPAPDVPFGWFAEYRVDVAMKELAALKQLRMLDLTKVYVTDAGVSVVATLPHLQMLCLNGTHVTDTGVRALVTLQELELLDLSQTSITDRGIRALKALGKLRALILRNTQITDAGAIALAGIEHLETLDLGCTHVTDEGVKQLARLMHLRNQQNFPSSFPSMPGVSDERDSTGTGRSSGCCTPEIVG